MSTSNNYTLRLVGNYSTECMHAIPLKTIYHFQEISLGPPPGVLEHLGQNRGSDRSSFRSFFPVFYSIKNYFQLLKQATEADGRNKNLTSPNIT